MVKKQVRLFRASIHIIRLNHVAGTTGSFYARLKIRKSGESQYKTKRSIISGSMVVWKEKWEPKIGIATTIEGELIPCICRITIYKETIRDSLREEMKVGHVDINLSSFAREEIYKEYNQILVGKDIKGQRQDNSTLEMELKMTLVAGDTNFFTPRMVSEPLKLFESAVDDLSSITGDDTWEFDHTMPTREHIRLTRANDKDVIDSVVGEMKLYHIVPANHPAEMNKQPTYNHHHMWLRQ